jgi:hypothetical protein
MNVFEQMVLGWIAFARTVREIFRVPLWAPWALLAAVHLVVVALLWWFAHPLVSWLMAPLLRIVGGEEALRYPQIFRMLPTLFGRFDVVVGAVLGSIMIGAGTLLFASRFRGGLAEPGEALRRSVQRAIPLVLASLPFNVMVVGLSFGVEWLIAERDSGAMVRRLAYAAVLGGSVVLQSLFLYVPALIVIEHKGVLGAFAALPRTWMRGFWSALLLGAVLILPLLPLHVLAGRASTLVERGTPELVGVLVVLQILVAMTLGFLLCGSATLVYLSTVAPEHDRGTA